MGKQALHASILKSENISKISDGALFGIAGLRDETSVGARCCVPLPKDWEIAQLMNHT